jgi:lipoprotein-anchoring transpeptidase ErfK/SrfK
MSSRGRLLSRRLFIAALPGAAWSLSGCATSTPTPELSWNVKPAPPPSVAFDTREQPGTIVVDPTNHLLYLVQGGGQALRYEVGVGKEGYGWSGVAAVHNKQEWPDWYPTPEYLEHKPELKQYMVQLQSGLGMHGGPDNPLGARALYLWQGRVDTLYRIHGTNEPDTIGHDVSAGCIRLRNEDVVDLYGRTTVGTKVVVLAPHAV